MYLAKISPQFFIWWNKHGRRTCFQIGTWKSSERNNSGGIINTNKIDQYTLKRVDSFKYLGTLINNKYDTHQDIKQRIKNGLYFHNHNTVFKSKLIFKESKSKLHWTYIRPILTCKCQQWATTKEDDIKTFYIQ